MQVSFFDKWNFPRRHPPGEGESDSTRLTNTPSRNKCSISTTFLRQAYPAFFMAVCALLVTLAYENLYPKWIWTDSAVFQYVGKVILSGGMPYRDTFDHKGPFLYLIQAAGLYFSNVGLCFLEFLALLLTFLYLYKIARLVGCKPYVACFTVFSGIFLLLSVPDGGNMTEEYALPFLSVSFYIFLSYFMEAKVTKQRLILCGLSCAAVALLRINICGLWIVMSLGVILQCAREKQFQKLLSHIGWFLLGFCVLTVPVLLWLYVNHAFRDFIQDYFLFNFQYSAVSGGTWQQKLNAIQEFMVKQTPFLLTSMCFLFYQSMTNKKLPDILCLFSFALNLYLMCFSGRTYPHYAMILLPLCVYALSTFLLEFPSVHKQRTIILTVIMLLCAFYGKTVLDNVRYEDTLQAVIVQVVQENSNETDSITVCGNMDGVYVVANRRSVSRYSYQTSPCFLDDSPQTMARREEYFRDVETGKPKLIVLPLTFSAYGRMKEIMGTKYRLLDGLAYVEVYILNDS